MILIDDRAGSRELVKHPPLDNPSIAELNQLHSGDAYFVGVCSYGESVVGIELKSISDMIGSRQSGRLQGVDGQIPEMLIGYDERWILTYGVYRCGDTGNLEHIRREKVKGKFTSVWHTYTFGSETFQSGDKGLSIGRDRQLTRKLLEGRPVPYAFLESTLISLSDVGIRHHHVYDVSQAARWIYALYLKRQKSWPEQCRMFRSWNQSREMTEGAYRRAVNGIDTAADPVSGVEIAPMPVGIDPIEYQIARTAASFPGVRYERSIAASRYFPSVLAMVTAPASQWEKVQGIGKVLSKSIHEAIRRTKR